MTGMDTYTAPRPASAAPVTSRSLASPAHAPIVPIREIGARYRDRIARHLTELDQHDRYLRFGFAANDRQIGNYVDTIHFERDRLLGIFNRKLDLVAVAHLAYPAKQTGAGFAEFGVSVSGHVRGRGYGSRLFQRAAIHAVNDGIKTLYIHALSENTAMLNIARHAGAVVERMGSESEAHLALPEASFRTRLDELVHGQAGRIDYLLKAEASLARNVFATVQSSVREAVRKGRDKAGV
jgi:RimJ/RimL family protein N-acetyltransferase